MHYIYLITNLNNEKIYVGQSLLTPEQRLREHIYSKLKKDYFHAAIRKHGKQAFVVQELGRYETQEQTNTAEKTWILLCDSCDKTVGYNTTYGGDFGAVPNEETRAKIGAYSRTRIHRTKTRDQMRKSHLDKPVPENNLGFRGVSLTPDCKKFRARSKVNGREIAFGYFHTPEEASKSREKNILILRNLTPEDVEDLLMSKSPPPLRTISSKRWNQWVADWMDAQKEKQLVDI